MSHGYADEAGMFHHGAHRYKVHARRDGDVTKYEVEWQRDWQTPVTLPEGNPTSRAWESTPREMQFSAEGHAHGFVKLVLDGEITPQGHKVGGTGAAEVVAGTARRTQFHFRSP